MGKDGSAKQNAEASCFSRTRVSGNERRLDGTAKQNVEAERFSRTSVSGNERGLDGTGDDRRQDRVL